MKTSKNQRKSVLPIVAVVVVAAAVLSVFLPRLLSGGEGAEAETVSGTAATLSDDGAAVVIDAAALGEEAAFYDYDVSGVTVELFAVKASDGSVRLALNTCQVCNGSPYAYFVQEGDDFVCQNCMNHFASTQVGLVSGGCNPVPITEEYFSRQGDTILVSTDFLQENAARFANWKNF